jgi:ADP-heptose:LPS heptosyltransferase
MKAPEHIVIFHPAAIGDTVLATPVAKILKRNFPNARLTYWAHPTLKVILTDMCPVIDDFVDYERRTLSANRSILKKLGADLFVDLSGSLKGRLIPLLLTGSVHYRKQSRSASLPQHAVDNFIDTIRPLCKEIPDSLFPTLFPSHGSSFIERTLNPSNTNKLPLIAVVPGVGNVRPSRAWPYERWRALLDVLIDRGSHFPVIIGGADDAQEGERLSTECKGRTLNLCSKLALEETATLLKECALVVSGDTGPAHIAVAVGTPVVGLYGPTLAGRSGPFGCEKLVLTQEQSCRCAGEKMCRYATMGSSGECISRITVDEVLAKIDLALS